MRPKTLYLLAYNTIAALGWALALFQIARHVCITGELQNAYSSAGSTVALFQLLSVLEIAHAAFGLTSGSPLTAAMQWVGRSNALYGVVAAVPTVQSSLAVGATLAAWAMSEVIRYPWYASSLLGVCPYWLTWLRYSAFILLYPIGLLGEMCAMWLALPEIQAKGLRTVSMPNQFNFGFDYSLFLKVLLAFYPFLWLRLYSFLLRQRQGKLGSTLDGALKRD